MNLSSFGDNHCPAKSGLRETRVFGELDCLFWSFSFLRTSTPLSIITMCVSNPCLVSFLYFHSHTLITNAVISYWLQVNLKCEDDTLVDREEKGLENGSKLITLNLQIKTLHMMVRRACSNWCSSSN